MHQLSPLIYCLVLFQGIIRRVTDSFTGLFSASWLSGWMGGEEEEESGEPQPGPSQASTHAPPGESFIFAHPVTARRSFRPFYPEEGKQEKFIVKICLLIPKVIYILSIFLHCTNFYELDGFRISYIALSRWVRVSTH